MKESIDEGNDLRRSNRTTIVVAEHRWAIVTIGRGKQGREQQALGAVLSAGAWHPLVRSRV